MAIRDTPAIRQTALDRARWFVFEHFELVLVLLLVSSMLAIHWFIDEKIAFLNFYYLPVIAAGFYLGRRGAVWSSVFIVVLVAFFEAFVGLNGSSAIEAGLNLRLLFTMIPWAGFLILTGYAVGTLADQRRARLEDLKGAYMTMLELMTFHLESSERHNTGHSFRVAERAVTLGRELGMRSEELEDLRVAALLHELGPQDPRLLRLFEQFPGDVRQLPIATSMRAAPTRDPAPRPVARQEPAKRQEPQRGRAAVLEADRDGPEIPERAEPLRAPAREPVARTGRAVAAPAREPAREHKTPAEPSEPAREDPGRPLAQADPGPEREAGE